MQRADTVAHEETAEAVEAEEYYPEEPIMAEWAKLAIQARVQHCDSHHLLMRGQWIVHDALVDLAGSSVFSRSASEIEGLLKA